jgi:DNA-binding CsgD family transcriptional regulator
VVDHAATAQAYENAHGVVGRDTELAAIRQWVEAVRTGPSALVIEGDAGIGKTTLWREAVAAVGDAGNCVVDCRPTAAELELPYVGLWDLFNAVPDAVLAKLPAPQRAALDVALLRIADEGLPLQRRAVAAAVLSTLVIWSRTTPVVVAIDDLQWLDVPSLRALQFAARRLGREAVGFVTASRTGAASPDRLELGLAFDVGAVVSLPLTPLGKESLDLLLRAHLGTAFLPPVLRRIEETSGGNPFLALELGRALLDPVTSTSAAEPLAVPSTLADLLGVRIGRMPGSVQEALLAAAALRHPTVPLVTQAVGYAGAKRLERAVAAGVITMREGIVRFTHPLLASVVYSGASSDQRRALHARLAELVTEPDERARHLALGADEPNEAVAATIESAASRAARRGAMETAAVLMEHAARLTPRTYTVALERRRLDAADHHIAAGETARARTLLEEAMANAATVHSRARALHRSGTVLMLEGHFATAEAPLREAVDLVGDDLALRAAIERDIAYALLQAGSPSSAVSHASSELRAAEASQDVVLIAEALDHLCMAKFLAGEGLDNELLARAVELDDQVGPAPPLDHPGPGTGRFPLAMTLKWTDRFDGARELFRSLHEEHAAQGDESALAVVLFHLGELECWSGNWEVATHLARQCDELGARTARAGNRRRAVTLQAMVDAYCGDADTARAEALASLEQCEATSDALGAIRSLKALGVLELSLEQYEPAVEHFRRAVDLEATAGYYPSVLRLLPDAIEAMVAVGSCDEATEVLRSLERAASGGDLPWVRATGARCRGVIQAATGDLNGARVSLQRATEEHTRLAQPFERARTLLVAGTVERRARQKRAARDALDEARQVFDTLGAQRWVNRATSELARIGGRPPRSLELSASERRVAELAAEGHTNREIASVMFLSNKTVESHLTHIYRKTGVESRRHLIGWLRGNPAPPESSCGAIAGEPPDS